MKARPLSASGLQITFFIFAVVFLAAPAAKFLGPYLVPEGEMPKSLGRIFIFVPAIALLWLIPQVRAFCWRELGYPISQRDRMEVSIVAASQVLLPFAIFGAVVLWHWTVGGEMALARRLGQQDTAAAEFARALSADELARLVLAVVVAPVIEELVFRGMLFRTWEAEWGWFKAMIATSTVFAAYHPASFSAFVGSIVLVALYRRTGSLRACILAHAVYNGLLWYPLMGRFVFRTVGKETGEIELWPFHLAMLALLAVALPVYVWMARDRDIDEPSAPEEICAARS